MKHGIKRIMAAALFSTCATATIGYAANDRQDTVKSVSDSVVLPIMAKYGIPGMAVGIVADGQTYVFNYGVASRQSRRPVTRDTLFEIGSVSKTFTATLASWAQVTGHLSMSDKAGKYLPNLQGSPFGNVTLVELGTHTPGGVPLQVPGNIRNEDQLMRYLKDWRPTYSPGTYRTYSNVSIGTLGLITATSMGQQDFAVPLSRHLLSPLGMKSSYVDVPRSRMADYAQGYTKDGAPTRMTTDVLSSKTYGIKTTAADLLRFVQANMGEVKLDKPLQQAITDTHTGYFNAGPMTQDLIWEQYPYPVALKTLTEGNSLSMALNAMPVNEIKPPRAPQQQVWINKTGSTDGFGAYVAFVPARHMGIVILANRHYPNEERVTAAHRILTSLGLDGR
ncbi:class C beta-lactamase [Burkholderia ubonensis]|uniref:Beta-lactamase n=1 Tax=Burkholderia ubonensis TaxID=101571 RepID=A0AB73G0S3_9BURK|nr:class C beta-lactamase [Burkholderia ubonensis]KVK82887.1 class C beta-lactamase [Burkholderia ubonensis]KVL63539.1 class C beta-lactamase [Burkholderia ubonensis]KVL66737.1 class C beta-lactamase [Burkholderia ubonensis]KVL80021.1 class C beta-lactamase [Burkholderia ubonensis]KVL83836.1 class C beta-lactamase [Burkholderia ubonensis]